MKYMDSLQNDAPLIIINIKDSSLFYPPSQSGKTNPLRF